MFSIIKKFFGSKENELFALSKNSSFKDAIEFVNPNEDILKELETKLVQLSKQNSSLTIEKPLKNKKVIEFSSIKDLVEIVKKDLEDNFIEYTTEFLGEPMGFSYYLGNQLLMSNSVEIVQEIYHKERSDIGNLYYSLVIKYSNGKYYYWKW